MNPFRLFNPLYVLNLERQLQDLARRANGLADIVDDEFQMRRGYLKTIATAMASGRISEAKTLVDAMILLLGSEDGV